MQVRCWSKTGTGLRDFVEWCDENNVPEAAGQWDAFCHLIEDLHKHPIRAYFAYGELRLFIGPPDPDALGFVWSKSTGWRAVGDQAAPAPRPPAGDEQR